MKARFLLPRAVFMAVLTIVVFPEISGQDEIADFGMAPIFPVPGYVIYSNGDTAWGTLTWSLKYVENNPVEIKFTPKNGTKQTLRAEDIAGFGNQLSIWAVTDAALAKTPIPFEDYISLSSWKKKVPVFMSRMINGRLTVYLNRASIGIKTEILETTSKIDGFGFNWVPGEGLTIGPTYHTDYRIIESHSRYSSYFVVKDGGNMVRVDKENYDSTFAQLFGDCPALQEEFSKNPDLMKFKNFMILAEVYNQLCPY